MKLTKPSMLTGKVHTLELPITEAELEAYQAQRRGGKAIQDYFPQLTPVQREFIMTGITDEEWQEFIVQDESDEEDD